jgi:DNA-directed RNA polymerase specialized sigma24 family protein
MRKLSGTQEHLEASNERFLRCRGLLHFMACRVLGGSERAQLAVENSRLTASLNPPRFDNEGAFRSWLLRILIDEALAILHKDRQANRPRSFAMTHQQGEEGVQHASK